MWQCFQGQVTENWIVANRCVPLIYVDGLQVHHYLDVPESLVELHRRRSLKLIDQVEMLRLK